MAKHVDNSSWLVYLVGMTNECPSCESGKLKTTKEDFYACISAAKELYVRIPNLEMEVCDNCGCQILPVESCKITDKILDSYHKKYMQITDQSKALFIEYANDAGNWGGMPMVDGNVRGINPQVNKGNLTQLKRAGLVTTFKDEGSTFLQFTQAGIDYAKEIGLDFITRQGMKS